MIRYNDGTFVFKADVRIIGIPDSKQFDIQLMIDLLRNLQLAKSIKNTKENEIDTINDNRNFIEHPSDLTDVDKKYDTIWNDVSKVCTILLSISICKFGFI